ncbi:hypothetical protein J7S33_02375, partial [Saccharothrix algeriensis]
MSAHRTRGLLRAAALLAVGTTPLLAGAASAAGQPLESLDGPLGDAASVDADVSRSATDLLGAPVAGADPLGADLLSGKA